MENFKINLDRPEPDRSKIQVKKDFKSFHASHFPKPSLFHSKWFWGVSGIASIALVVTITLTSFKYNQPEKMVQTNQLEKSSVKMEDSFLSSPPKPEFNAVEILEAEDTESTRDFEKTKIKTEEQEQSERKITEEIVEPEKANTPELFKIDFSPSDFPNLEVGNNLFYFDPSEEISPEEVFAKEWEGIELERSSNGILLKLTDGLKVSKFKVVQYAD